MSKKPKRKQKRYKPHIYVGVFALLILIALSFSVYAINILRSLPSLEQFSFRKISESTKIYDKTGKTLLYEVFGEEKRTIISFEDVPEFIKQATLAAEDAGFYNQPAFDWKGIARALITNIKEGQVVQGGSTITQQLVKNAFLSPERTVTRKVKELILAIELEKDYTKDEIFSAYLNQIPYGSNAYGIEAASRTFFNKSVANLSIAEASALAALPRAPSYYSPWGANTEKLLDRKNYVLNRMHELGYLSEKERDLYQGEKLSFAPPSLGVIKAPHFSLAIKDYLIEKYGEEIVRAGGLKVITTLDWELQQIAEDVIARGAERNEALYGGKNASLVAQDTKTGQVLALVGSRDWYNEEIDGQFNVAIQGLRQPGSALKPFAYLTAFDKGYNPETKLFDVHTEFVVGDPNCPAVVTPSSDKNTDCYNPDNFDNFFRGPVSMEQGLAQSINVPSVKTLYLAGFDDVLGVLRQFGITTLKERWRYGLSLVLGGGETRLIELVGAYATLAEEGVYHDQSFILRVEDSDGSIIEEYSDRAEKVFEKQPTRQINQILSDKELRSGLFQSSLGLTLFPGREVALKTGTTNDYQDAWAMGYTPGLAVGVWAGNNDNTPMHRQGSSILAAIPMWSEFLNKAFELDAYNQTNIFTRPDASVATDKPMLGGNFIYSPLIEGKNYPQLHSILYWIDRNDPAGTVPVNLGKDSQFYNWEAATLDWAYKIIPGFNTYNKQIPPGVNFSEATQNNNIAISNLMPQNGSFVRPPFVATANISSLHGLRRVETYLNDKLVHSQNVFGNDFRWIYGFRDPLKPQNILELKVYDSKNNEASVTSILFKND